MFDEHGEVVTPERLSGMKEALRRARARLEGRISQEADRERQLVLLADRKSLDTLAFLVDRMLRECV